MKYRPRYAVRKTWRQPATHGSAGTPALPEGSGEPKAPRPPEASTSRYLTPYHFSPGDRITWACVGRVRTAGTVVRRVNADVIRIRLETGKERDLCPCWCDYIRNETTGREYRRPKRAALTLLSQPVVADRTVARPEPQPAATPVARYCVVCHMALPAVHQAGRQPITHVGVCRKIHYARLSAAFMARKRSARRAKQATIRTYRTRKNRRAA